MEFQAERFRNLRRALGLTQREIAHALHTHERQIVRWEQGEARPRTKAVKQIAECLGVPVTHLTGDAGFATSIPKDSKKSRQKSHGREHG